MTPAPLHFAGETLMLDPAGALYWPADGLLAVADLHFEKGSSYARYGMLLPPWDTRATLDRLAALMRRWTPRIVVALGDSFHDAHGTVRLSAADAARLVAMTQAAHFVWVLGNHDPTPPSGLAGEAVAEYASGRLVFRHRSHGNVAGEISGHFHPKAAVPARASQLTRPCFVCDGKRLLLPAFGAYTGGLDVTHPAIAALFPRGGRVFLLGRDRLFSFQMFQIRQGSNLSRSV